MEHINTLKVMIVDDEFPIRKWFSRAIKNLPDIKVDFAGAASNGEEALQIFREKRPDVVFTDIKMPIMDGLSLLRQIKRNDRKQMSSSLPVMMNLHMPRKQSPRMHMTIS